MEASKRAESANPADRNPTWLPVATVAEVRAKGVVVIKSAAHPIAVFADGDNFLAVDNRCPHLGFPLAKGTVKDGILTCHWHHANFDLKSGCAFDTWADDIASYAVRVVGGAVEVAASPRRTPDLAFHQERLRRGLDQDLGLLQAKSIIGLLGLGATTADIVRAAVFCRLDFLRNPGALVDITIASSLAPAVSAQTGYLLLARGVNQVASGSRNNRRPQMVALEGEQYDVAAIRRWFRQFVADRRGDGAERILLTAITQGWTPAQLVDLIVGTAGERIYAGQGHVVDFAMQACELLDHIGWDHAARVLPLVVPQLVEARGAEEDGGWRHPVDLITPLLAAQEELRAVRTETSTPSLSDDAVVEILLGDDPALIISTLTRLLAAGGDPADLARLVCYAAARRLAHFAAANEVGDWFNPRHSFSFANAVFCAIERSPTPDVVRSLLHAALAVYRDRFLNMPPARLPANDPAREHLPTAADELLRLLNAAFDGRSAPERAGLLVSRYLQQGHPLPRLADALALATVREDFDFHPLQTLDAALRQCQAWQSADPEHAAIRVEHICVALARSLAAVCPTPRGRLKTALIAQRLQRGDHLHEEE
jgi:nitrite reductase/ring-hydroxylating ferredoxin subunit